MGPRTDTPLWTRSYLTNLTATFAFWFNVDFLLLALPLYMRSVGFDAAAIGLVFGAAAPAAIVARLLSGRLIDRTGGRLFLLVGAAAWAVGSAAMAFTEGRLLMLVALRLLQGAGLGIFTNASLAYVSYSVAPTRRDEALGWWAAATPIMATLAPVTAALVAQRFGFTPAFLVAAAAGVIATFAGLLLPRLKRDQQVPDSVTYRPYVLAALVPGCFGGVVAIASGSFAAFAPLLAAERGVDNVGLLLTCSAFGSILVRFVAGPLAARKGRSWVVIPGLTLAAVALMLLGVAHSDFLLFTAPFLFGIGAGAAMPGLLGWAVARAGEGERATAGGTFFAFFEVGLFMGPPLLGGFIEQSGFIAFAVPALLLASASAAYLVVVKRFDISGQ